MNVPLPPAAPPATPAVLCRYLPAARLLVESDPVLRVCDEVRLANRLRILAKRLAVMNRIR